jgi:hypothetical protein
MQRMSIKSGIHGATYFFNTTLRENHSFTNTITQNPVQEGAYVNDHVYQQPITFTADIGESDCMGSTSSSFSSSKQAFTALETMWKEVDPLTITTEFSQYKDMLIESFNVSRDYKTMNAMRATIIFQQIIVTNAVEISMGKTNLGTKSGTTSEEYKTLKISASAYTNIKVKYKGQTMALENYFRKYSSSQSKFTKNNAGGVYTITPIINGAIANGSTFLMGAGITETYNEFVKGAQQSNYNSATNSLLSSIIGG